MEKNYVAEHIEQDIYQTWEQNDCFADGQAGATEPYCIILPPPNVTGNLHMGHAFQSTVVDALIRYNRMCGKNTHWQPGTDHAGIATQMLVERQLAAQGIDRKAMGRTAFIEAVWDWKRSSEGAIKQQLKRIGASLNWSKDKFTLDDDVSHAVREVFVRLYEEGLLYRGKRLVNWDPVLQTAVSDLEVVNVEATGFMYYVHYPFVDDSENSIVIGTTRPETILADGAIAVHPDDERFSKLLGKKVWVPLTDRQIEIIADEYVDPEFGSGCVKITGAHDFNDFEVTKRHADKNLPLIELMTKTATMNENAPKAYQGLDRFVAREKIVKDLDEAGLLKDRKAHKYVLPKGDRSQAVLEPMLTDQWFVDAKTLAREAIEVVKQEEIKFVPRNWENTYFEWMNNIQDWCISRQLWWGHRIPAWYGENGEMFVAHDEAQAQAQADKQGYKGSLTQDEDVLDTWFSSALWPFSTLGWPNQAEDLETFYPTSVLVTGFDIIFFWVARMIMFGQKFTGKVPFREVYVHGLVRDALGQKMSKSKGNVLDPIDIIDGISLEALVAKRTSGLMQPQHAERIERETRVQFAEGIPAYGCDALRFTFSAMASTGRDIRFELSRCEGYRNFCNKLWNAGRFILLRVEGQAVSNTPSTHAVDQWINSRLQHTITAVNKGFDTYRLDHVANAIYEFVWHDFCDWYLEFIKVLLQNEDEQAAQTRHNMLQLMDAICRLAHPIIPFISESVWQAMPKSADQKSDSERATIMIQSYPVVDEQRINQEAEQEIQWMQAVISGVRSIRSQMNIAPNKRLECFIATADVQEQKWLNNHLAMLCEGAKLTSLTRVEGEVDASASAICGAGKLYLPLSGTIDFSDELVRNERDQKKLIEGLDLLSKKLNNPSFTNNAPEAVVLKVRTQYAQKNTALKHLQDQHAKFSQLV